MILNIKKKSLKIKIYYALKLLFNCVYILMKLSFGIKLMHAKTIYKYDKYVRVIYILLWVK